MCKAAYMSPMSPPVKSFCILFMSTGWEPPVIRTLCCRFMVRVPEVMCDCNRLIPALLLLDLSCIQYGIIYPSSYVVVLTLDCREPHIHGGLAHCEHDHV